MADTLPIPTRSGVAREPLDPTNVVPGPQPIDFADRDGHHVIVGEVLKPGRHRAARPRRVAVSGAVLSAAGAFATLAFMMSHQTASTTAGPRVAPSTPIPELPDEPAAAQTPAHPAEAAARAHAAAPAAVHTATRHTVIPARGYSASGAAQQMRNVAEQMRRAEAAWDSAMRQQAGRHYAAGPADAGNRQEAPRGRAESWQRYEGGGPHRGEDGRR